MKNYIDILLHTIGGIIFAAIAYFFPHQLSIVFLIWALGFLREAAQENKSDLIKALQNFPKWGKQSHFEWIAWPFGAILCLNMINLLIGK